MSQIEATASTPKAPELNEEQRAALEAIDTFLKSDEPFFVLSGSAGTGKTFCIRQLTEGRRGRFIFTAPTNKATKVLRDSVSSKGYKPECKTIYSLLGLRLEATGEVKALAAPEDPIDLSAYVAVIVDEGSMVNKQLMHFIREAADSYGVKFIFMGDQAQLPPVGEKSSPIWDIKTGAHLARVMRYDNQILSLATQLREQVDKIAPTIKLVSNNADGEGIWKMSEGEFEHGIVSAASAGYFSQINHTKAVAWRNVTVDRWNKIIRLAIFGSEAPSTPWFAGDRVIFTAPAKDLNDETIATTDDEGTVERVIEEWHPIHGEFRIHRVSITLDDNRPVVARVLHPDYLSAFARRADELATAAKSNGKLWRKFWDFKDSFHGLRHAYAITAHRAQGSTYERTFVDWRDILVNRDRQEGFRCLYVACTRPKKILVLN